MTEYPLPENTKKLYTEMPLIAPIQTALKQTGYTHPTPIQEAVIPLILDKKDILGIAQTGTGKTAAFCLPLIQNLYSQKQRPKEPRVLILAPTRELALQIHENFQQYSQFANLKSAAIFGGVGQTPQVNQIRQGVDVLIATTGRLLDLYEQKYINFSKIECLVLDEADRMLDMGFYPDIQRILKLVPQKRQNLFFSATMPKEVTQLASQILKDPIRVEITPESKTADKVEQFAYYVDKDKKLDLLIHLLQNPDLKKVIVFTEMKHVANRLAEKLVAARIKSSAIHGNKSQSARQKALDEFKSNKLRVLVATDIAARGIDVDDITHVINFELSHLTENYVHRIGRTARASASGTAISFCTAEEKSFLFAIEKTIRQKIPIIVDQPFHSDSVEGAQIHSLGKAKAILESRRLEVKNQRRKEFRKNKPAKKSSDSSNRPAKSFNRFGGKKKSTNKSFSGYSKKSN